VVRRLTLASDIRTVSFPTGTIQAAQLVALVCGAAAHAGVQLPPWIGSVSMNQVAPVARDPSALHDLVVGKDLAGLYVYGINSLKTVDPPLSQVAIDKTVDLSIDEEARSLKVVLERHTFAIDLARTGTAVLLSAALPWSPSDGTAMPTIRFIFSDGSGMDLREPAKTKRITITIGRN